MSDTIVLDADLVGGTGSLPEQQLLPTRIRSFFSHAAEAGHMAADGLEQRMATGGEPLTSLGISLTQVLHGSLQRSMTEEQNDPLMQSMRHDHPDEYAHHVHDMQQADLAVETIGGLLGALEQRR